MRLLLEPGGGKLLLEPDGGYLLLAIVLTEPNKWTEALPHQQHTRAFRQAVE